MEKVAGLPDVAGLLTDFKSNNTRYVLAARVTGPVATAFPRAARQPPVSRPNRARPARRRPIRAKPPP